MIALMGSFLMAILIGASIGALGAIFGRGEKR